MIPRLEWWRCNAREDGKHTGGSIWDGRWKASECGGVDYKEARRVSGTRPMKLERELYPKV